MRCACGNNFTPYYNNNPDDVYCSKCRELINKTYNYMDREYEHESITNRISEIGE